MTRRRLLLAALALAAFVATAEPLLAQGKGKGKDKDPDPKDTAEWKECAAVGREFRDKDASALVDRMRGGEKAKVRLTLDESGDYGKGQAKTVLENWFKDRSELKTEMKSIDGLTGTLDASWRKEGSEKKVEKKLYVTIEKREKGGGFFLVKLELH